MSNKYIKLYKKILSELYLKLFFFKYSIYVLLLLMIIIPGFIPKITMLVLTIINIIYLFYVSSNIDKFIIISKHSYNSNYMYYYLLGFKYFDFIQLNNNTNLNECLVFTKHNLFIVKSHNIVYVRHDNKFYDISKSVKDYKDIIRNSIIFIKQQNFENDSLKYKIEKLKL